MPGRLGLVVPRGMFEVAFRAVGADGDVGFATMRALALHRKSHQHHCGEHDRNRVRMRAIASRSASFLSW